MLELCLLGLYIQRAWRQFAKNKRQLDGYVTKQWEIEPAFLAIKQKIGRGAFANVHHGTAEIAETAERPDHDARGYCNPDV
ncbi:unnamed protein product, partial [Mesorhabditis spiculigera]